MIIFKTFLKIVNKNKFIVLMYTAILVLFLAFNLQTADTQMNFTATKPDVFIVNEDVEEGITQHLIDYIEKNSNIVKISSEEEKINDALFYREVNYVIYIPKNYRIDFLNKKDPQIKIKSTGDYQASLAEMLLKRYIRVTKAYQDANMTEEEILQNAAKTLKQTSKIELTSKLDATSLETASFYYNFTNYSILAGCVYIICLVLASFNEEKIRKRTIVSSMSDYDYQKKILLANSLFALTLWFIYVILSILLIGNIMFSFQGILFILNSLVFSICALTIAFLIGTLCQNRNAINGVVNVLALGSSFLCGAFVPMEFLPEPVLFVAHILPSYYYIRNNELIKKLEIVNLQTVKPVAINMFLLLCFALLFIVITNRISKIKRKEK